MVQLQAAALQRNSSTCKSGQIDKAATKGKGGQAGQEEPKASAPASGDWESERRLQSYFCPGQMHVHGDGRSACAAAHAMQGPASSAV